MLIRMNGLKRTEKKISVDESNVLEVKNMEKFDIDDLVLDSEHNRVSILLRIFSENDKEYAELKYQNMFYIQELEKVIKYKGAY